MTNLPIPSIRSSVRALASYKPGKPIEEVQAEYGLSRVIKLASNENPLGTNPTVIEAMKNHLDRLFRYPDATHHELKSKIAHSLSISPDRLTIGNGSEEIIRVIVHTFSETADELIYPQYGFEAYPLICQKFSMTPVVVPAQEWGCDLSAMIKAITPRTKIILFANPNNPTGAWCDHQAIETFLSQVPEQVIVIIDEAYRDFMDTANYPDTLALQSRYPNLLITRTFSKIHGLAGLRLGYAITHPDIAPFLNRVRDPFNLNVMAQVAGIAALADPTFVKQTLMVTEQGKRQVLTGFENLGLQLLPYPANFFTVNLERNADAVFQSLLREGIIVRPLTAYQLPNFIRVTIGTEEENALFLQALEKVLATT